ncbi:hypothetical protein CAOG_009381 [Capsaspora owczarzaki ATCC 30864]|uniref:Uncharacterized protein n=1 Tax=Capsaspora owczarzaki (strain ATCC 30864) TaxID=595528 RepID=A0A0D2WIK2_CAPO3|nr:hypothetical protein CAOG_009381 [Capsaspora owczarzaki ATCC 30864]
MKPNDCNTLEQSLAFWRFLTSCTRAFHALHAEICVRRSSRGSSAANSPPGTVPMLETLAARKVAQMLPTLSVTDLQDLYWAPILIREIVYQSAIRAGTLTDDVLVVLLHLDDGYRSVDVSNNSSVTNAGLLSVLPPAADPDAESLADLETWEDLFDDVGGLDQHEQCRSIVLPVTPAASPVGSISAAPIAIPLQQPASTSCQQSHGQESPSGSLPSRPGSSWNRDACSEAGRHVSTPTAIRRVPPRRSRDPLQQLQFDMDDVLEDVSSAPELPISNREAKPAAGSSTAKSSDCADAGLGQRPRGRSQSQPALTLGRRQVSTSAPSSATALSTSPPMPRGIGGFSLRACTVHIVTLDMSFSLGIIGGGAFVRQLAERLPALADLRIAGCFDEETGPETLLTIFGALTNLVYLDASKNYWLSGAELDYLVRKTPPPQSLLPRLSAFVLAGCPMLRHEHLHALAVARPSLQIL